jgi:hypothetical protein
VLTGRGAGLLAGGAPKPNQPSAVEIGPNMAWMGAGSGAAGRLPMRCPSLAARSAESAPSASRLTEELRRALGSREGSHALPQGERPWSGPVKDGRATPERLRNSTISGNRSQIRDHASRASSDGAPSRDDVRC